MAVPSGKSIGDLFYETRVLKGRDYSLRRFAREVLKESVDAALLSCIEKGTRFPSEPLVQRLAAARQADERDLLPLLWRERMLRAFGNELRRVLKGPRAVQGVDDAELALVVSRAIAALPDDASWVPVVRWRKAFQVEQKRKRRRVPRELANKVEKILVERDLVEIRKGRVRRHGRHFVPSGTEQRQSLAKEFFTLFAKALLDELVLPETGTGSYLRNHYLNIDPERLDDFHRELDEMIRKLTQKYAEDDGLETRFFNVLVAGTSL